jgi:hypothetical protein
MEGVASMGGTFFRTSYIGLDFNAVLNVADRCGVFTGPSFLGKLRVFETEALRLMGAPGTGKKGCTAAKKEACRKKYGRHYEWTCANCEQNPARKIDGK